MLYLRAALRDAGALGCEGTQVSPWAILDPSLREGEADWRAAEWGGAVMYFRAALRGRWGVGVSRTQGFTLGYSRSLPPGGRYEIGKLRNGGRLCISSGSVMHGPPGRWGLWGVADPGFHPGLFSIPPSGRERRIGKLRNGEGAAGAKRLRPFCFDSMSGDEGGGLRSSVGEGVGQGDDFELRFNASRVAALVTVISVVSPGSRSK